jgi:hypothetical protein
MEHPFADLIGLQLEAPRAGHSQCSLDIVDKDRKSVV